MQKRKIFLVCVLLIFAGLVFSPITASASITFGSCTTSKYGVTAKVDLAAYYYVAGQRSKVYTWLAMAHAWGRGARVSNTTIATLNGWGTRQTIRTYKGWHQQNGGPYFCKGCPLKGGFGITMWQASSRSRQRCTAYMRTNG